MSFKRIKNGRRHELGLAPLPSQASWTAADLDAELDLPLRVLLSRPIHTGGHERTQAIATREWAAVLMSFPALHALAGRLPRPAGKQSRSLLLWALAFSGEAGGEAAVEEWCRDPLNWLMLRAWHRDGTGEDLTSRPLTASVLTKYWTEVSSSASFVDDLEDAFIEVMVAAARELGAFSGEVVRDVLDPSLVHVVFGDGTLCKARTDVELLEAEVDGEPVQILRGSRARTGPPRISNTGSFDKYGKKNLRAVNMVQFGVEVGDPMVVSAAIARDKDDLPDPAWSRFIVAAAHSVNAKGATEKHLAMGLLRRLKTHCGEGLHGVVYDMELESEAGTLLHELDLPFYGLVAARGRRPKASSTNPELRQLQQTYKADRARRNEGKRARSSEPREAAPLLAQRQAQDRLRSNLEDLQSTLPQGQHLIVERGLVKLKSTAVHTGEKIKSLRHSHTDQDGQVCEHTLAIDNGAVYDLARSAVGPSSGQGRRLYPVTAEQVDDGPSLNWRLEYPLLCGEQVPTFALLLEAGDRHKLGAHLRFLSEGDPRFARLYAHGRNTIESYNDWAKRRLWRGRAMHDAIDMQRLDFFGIALRHNSRTWHERTKQA